MKGEAANQRLKRRGFVFYSEEYMPKSEVPSTVKINYHMFRCYLCRVHSKVPLCICPISVKGT